MPAVTRARRRCASVGIACGRCISVDARGAVIAHSCSGARGKQPPQRGRPFCRAIHRRRPMHVPARLATLAGDRAPRTAAAGESEGDTHMARPSSQHPTELELQILQILWRDGPAPVRHVRDTLAGVRDLAYTSVLTVMNIMTRKGYLRREKVDGSYVYWPQVDKDRTTGGMLRDLINRAFGGSAKAVMLNLLETREIDRDELKELRDLIAEQAAGDAPSGGGSDGETTSSTSKGQQG